MFPIMTRSESPLTPASSKFAWMTFPALYAVALIGSVGLGFLVRWGLKAIGIGLFRHGVVRTGLAIAIGGAFFTVVCWAISLVQRFVLRFRPMNS